MDPPNLFLYQLHSYDAPSNIPYVFVRRVVNNIHIVNTACWLKSKYLRIYNENLQKQVQYFFSNGGRASGAPVLDPPLIVTGSYLLNTYRITKTKYFLVNFQAYVMLIA